MDTPAPGRYTRTEVELYLNNLIPRDPLPQHIDDSRFLEIAEWLDQHEDRHVRRWAQSPRVYTLLRLLRYEHESTVFNAFASEQIRDVWLPLGPLYLTYFASKGLNPDAFLQKQIHFLSQPERIADSVLSNRVHEHRNLSLGRAQFEEVVELGSGSSAQVAHIRHRISGQEFACKRIFRASTIRRQREQLEEFEQEVLILSKRLQHRHIVSFVASYTDLNTFSLILKPVAQASLRDIIEKHDRDNPIPSKTIEILRNSFGCLATTLEYVHNSKVRHKDIKPGNILFSDGRVYLCDFGISKDWSMLDGSTTSDKVRKWSKRYCAPEVLGPTRNPSADIWSLGCVFLEVTTIIMGYTIDEMNAFLANYSGGESEQGLWAAPNALQSWLTHMRTSRQDGEDEIPFWWISQMVREEPGSRPSAATVVEMINCPSTTSVMQPLSLARAAEESTA